MFVFVFVGCRFSSVSRFLRLSAIGGLYFFLVDALHEMEGICEKVDGGGGG